MHKWFKFGLMLATSALLASCGQVDFSKVPTIDSSTNLIQASPAQPPVCAPGGPGSVGHGLVADKIYYRSNNQSTSLFGQYSDFVTNGNVIDRALFLNNTNLPDLWFDFGFKDTAGNQVMENDGATPLTEYFGFEAKSIFTLGNWTPGDYQIAVLSDDGSILDIQGATLNPDGSHSDFIINNDSVHSMRMGCSAGIVHIDGQSQFQLSFKYFQAPRVTIGMMLLYRALPSGNPQDPLCGQGAGSDTFFFADHDSHNNPINPSIPQQPYLDLQSRGWQPVEDSHYNLPGNTNPCTQ